MVIDIIKPQLCHIVYDMDDVLADFWKTALPLLNKEFGKDIKRSDFTAYNSFVTDYGISSSDFLDFVANKVPLIDLDVNTPFQHLINAQYAHGHVITIITSRDYITDADLITREWLAKNSIPFHNLYISGKTKKSDFLVSGADIAYDDHHANIDDYLDNEKIK